MKTSNSRSGIFLMELIAAILFFALAASLCLEMFAKSHQISNEAKCLNTAANQSANAAELLKGAAALPDTYDGGTFFPDCLLTEYPDAETGSGFANVCYDKDWRHCAKEQGAYCMTITEQPSDDGLSTYQIDVRALSEDAKSIYSFDLKLHIPNRR